MDSRSEAALDIEYAFERRFRRPAVRNFAVGASLLSVASLLVLAGLAATMLLQLQDPGRALVSWPWLQPPRASGTLALWTWLPFAVATFSAGLGFVVELGLLLAGTPFQPRQVSLMPLVTGLRRAVLAPLLAAIFVSVCFLTLADPALRTAALFVSAGLTSVLGFALFFDAPVIALLVAIQAAEIALVLGPGVVAGGRAMSLLLAGQAVALAVALVRGTATPARSAFFHGLAAIALCLLYRAVVLATGANPGFSHAVAIAAPPASLLRWSLVAVFLGGLIAAARAFPASYAILRAGLSNVVWSTVYFLLTSQPFPKPPANLSDMYARSGAPARLRFRPYFMNHPRFLPQPLSVPSAQRLEKNVWLSGGVSMKEKVFALIELINRAFPQADVTVPIAQKPRMAVWSDGSEYWPRLFARKILGQTVPGGELEKAPEPAIAAYQKGQLLAYLTLCGISSTFAKPAPDRGSDILAIDFRFLEGYETKPDYHRYGGMAFFRVNARTQSLDLVSIMAPGSTRELAADPCDSAFRLAESQILATVYFQTVCGKHLGEIHMMYNLVECALHNAFDSQEQWTHPLRTALYLHLWAHELAEEVNTGFLFTEGGVFSQIFATTADSLIDRLNDVYRDFRYGEDEDFAARAAAMTMRDSAGRELGLLPNACIAWELEYAGIWQRYADDLVAAIYPDDAAADADVYLQLFHSELAALLPRGLPERYARFATRAGVARFVADTIHHLVIRHQVYGTEGIRAALDPRLGNPQVPRDGGPPVIDEWRSLAGIATATERARFSPMLGHYEDLIRGVDQRYAAAMRTALAKLQSDLHALNTKWTATETDIAFNYDYFRPVPADLRTGAGF